MKLPNAETELCAIERCNCFDWQKHLQVSGRGRSSVAADAGDWTWGPNHAKRRATASSVPKLLGAQGSWIVGVCPICLFLDSLLNAAALPYNVQTVVRLK